MGSRPLYTQVGSSCRTAWRHTRALKLGTQQLWNAEGSILYCTRTFGFAPQAISLRVSACLVWCSLTMSRPRVRTLHQLFFLSKAASSHHLRFRLSVRRSSSVLYVCAAYEERFFLLLGSHRLSSAFKVQQLEVLELLLNAMSFLHTALCPDRNLSGYNLELLGGYSTDSRRHCSRDY